MRSRKRISLDADGDNKADLALFRPVSGQWFVLLSGTGFTAGTATGFGQNGDVPVPGDYDGDGKGDLAVYRPSTPVGGCGLPICPVSSVWTIRTSSSGYASSLTFSWGTRGDVPVPGDYDGDGQTDIAVYRPFDNTWYILLSTTSYASSVEYAWGVSGDVPTPKNPIAYAMPWPRREGRSRRSPTWCAPAISTATTGRT